MAGERFGLSVGAHGPLGAVRRLLTYIGTFLGNALIYPVSRLFPRDPRRLAFGAPSGRFEGNAKYLFLWLNAEDPAARPAWITENAALVTRLRASGYRAFRRWSIGGMWAAARAGIFLVNDNGSDVNFALSGGARIFNLWHGVGLKNVNRGARVGYGAGLKRAGRNPITRIRSMRRLQRPHWVLATSEQTAGEFFARCFELPVSRTPALGYPRLDPMIDPGLRSLAASFEDYADLNDMDAFSRSLLYVPTLRVVDADLLATALPDVARLGAALAKQDAVLYIKLHPKTQRQSDWNDALPDNIRILSDDIDLYPVLDKFDGMITDFSSLYFEYLAVRSSGITLYPFDYDDYIRRDRDLAYDYDDVSVGLRVDSFAELCHAIENGDVFAPVEPTKLTALRQQFWDGTLGPHTACSRINAYLKHAGEKS